MEASAQIYNAFIGQKSNKWAELEKANPGWTELIGQVEKLRQEHG